MQTTGCVSTPAYSFTFNGLSNAARYKSRAITRYILTRSTDPACLIMSYYTYNDYFQLTRISEENVTQSAERINAKHIDLYIYIYMLNYNTVEMVIEGWKGDYVICLLLYS